MNETEELTALRRHRIRCQQAVWNDIRQAVIAELDGDARDAMLRQLRDIAKTYGLGS